MTSQPASSSDKPVLVTGASGFVGSHEVRLLVQQGRRVRVLLRKTSSQAAIEGLPVEVCYGDVLDAESLKAAMDGCSTVFYSVVDPRFWLTDPTPIYRNNVEGLTNAMDVALELGIERFIFTSTMGTLGFNPNGPVTEDIEFNWYDQASPYILARLKAEQTFMHYCHEKGLPGVALCVANTYGPQDYQPTPHGGMLWKVASGQTKAVMDSSAPMVDIRDVAQAALAAETQGKLGERYIIAHEYISNREFFTIATQWAGRKPPKVIPHWVAEVVASVAEVFIKLFGIKDALLSKDAVFLSGAFKAMDHSKASRDLGFQPRPVQETVRDALAWYAQREKERN